MKTFYRVPLIAVILLVVLRLSIGWQFVYEGLWKLETLKTNDPWTSEGYLKNAQGPLRDYFRNMTGDPDDLRWLDYAAKSQDWYHYRDRFVSFYGLNDEQKNKLNILVDGSAAEDSAPDALPPTVVYSQRLNALPEGVSANQLPAFAKYDADKKTLAFTGMILANEEANLLSLVDAVRKPDNTFSKRSDPALEATPDAIEYLRAVERLGTLSRQLSLRSKLAAHLRGNPDTAGVSGRTNDRGSFDFVMGTVTADQVGATANNVVYGKIQEFKDLVLDYNKAVAAAKMNFQNDHATMLARKVAIMKSELVTPVRVLERQLKSASLELLTPEQLAKGALPVTDSPLAKSDRQVMWGLIILGTLLLVGLCTRVAAVLGAVMLMMFYMVMPPWPGVPAAPGPEHSLIVNKNMIEAIALLAIAALPSGSWFGIDAIFSRLFRRRSGVAAVALTPPSKADSQTTSAPSASPVANPNSPKAPETAPISQGNQPISHSTGSSKKNKGRR